MIAFAVMTPGCNSGTFREPMTITDVIENIDRLNGRTVRVAGYLGECRGYDCHLFRNPAEKARLERLFEQARAGADSGGGPPPPVDETPVLSIGTGDGNDFDAKAGPFANSYVVITGRVTNQCRFNGRPDCTDRGPDLQPTGIAGWSGHP